MRNLLTEEALRMQRLAGLIKEEEDIDALQKRRDWEKRNEENNAEVKEKAVDIIIKDMGKRGISLGSDIEVVSVPLGQEGRKAPSGTFSPEDLARLMADNFVKTNSGLGSLRMSHFSNGNTVISPYLENEITDGVLKAPEGYEMRDHKGDFWFKNDDGVLIAYVCMFQK